MQGVCFVAYEVYTDRPAESMSKVVSSRCIWITPLLLHRPMFWGPNYLEIELNLFCSGGKNCWEGYVLADTSCRISRSSSGRLCGISKVVWTRSKIVKYVLYVNDARGLCPKPAVIGFSSSFAASMMTGTFFFF